jgi:HEAT repeat protein
VYATLEAKGFAVVFCSWRSNFVAAHFVVGFAAAGCNLISQPIGAIVAEKDPADPEKSAATSGLPRAGDVQQLLSQGRWIERHRQTGDLLADESADLPRYRWRHAGLEAVLSTKKARRQLRATLQSNDKNAASTAAIGLAWLDESRILPKLVEIARDTTLDLAMRGAAIEGIGRLKTAKADEAIEQLASQFGQYQGAAKAQYQPQLHADLLRAMATRSAELHQEALRPGLSSPDALARLEATRAYAVAGRKAPRELADRAADESPTVRAAALRTLSAMRHEHAQACAVRGLDDYDLKVQLAAISAIGMLPGAENSTRLKKLAASSSELHRAAAYQALAKRGELSVLLQAVADRSWRVRSVAAKHLILLPEDQRATVAETLIGDPSLQVQRQLVLAIGEWPLDEAIPVLLRAAEGNTAVTRRMAIEQLASRWSEAQSLSAQASLETLHLEVERLREVWQGRSQSARLPQEVSLH